MALKRIRQELRNYFLTGLRPTAENFAELIESNLNILEDKASEAEAQAGSDIDKFITPITARKAIDGYVKVNDKALTNGQVTIEVADISNLSSTIAGINSAITNKQDTLVSGTNIKTINGQEIIGPGDIEINAVSSNSILYATDFISGTSNQLSFNGTSIAGGTMIPIPSTDMNHPGQVKISKVVAVNSGYVFSSYQLALRKAIGLKSDFIVNVPSNYTNKGIRMGFLNSLSSVLPTYGAYFEIIGNNLSVITVNTAANKTITPLSYSLAINTWYHFRIQFLDLNSVKFQLYSDSNQILTEVIVNTNLPSNDVQMACVINAYGTSSTAEELIIIDYMSLSIGNINRGNL